MCEFQHMAADSYRGLRQAPEPRDNPLPHPALANIGVILGGAMKVFWVLAAGALLAISLHAQTTDTRTSPELIKAIMRGDASAVSSLLDSGVRPTAAGGGDMPPIMAAALFANAEILEQLLKRGADPNAADPDGATALMWAVRDHPD